MTKNPTTDPSEPIEIHRYPTSDQELPGIKALVFAKVDRTHEQRVRLILSDVLLELPPQLASKP